MYRAFSVQRAGLRLLLADLVVRVVAGEVEEHVVE
jgi:hypothetical protein